MSIVPLSRLLLLCVCSLSLASLTSCSGTGTPDLIIPPAAIPASQWVVAWGASPQTANSSAANPGGAEQSFRSIVLPTIDGTQERVHFSNVYGTGPVTIGSARVAVALSGAAVDASTDRPLTFSGSTSVTISPGQQVTSDPVNVTYSYGQKLAISTYLKGTFAPLTSHNSYVTTNYQAGAGLGDQTTDTSGNAFGTANTEWFLLTGVDVYGPYQGTVVLFGSSSIDGYGSNYSSTAAYPAPNSPVSGQDNERPSDWLAKNLLAAGYRVGVLNAGEAADPAAEDAITARGVSQAGVDRIQRDALAQAGVKAVLIYLGGVDLRIDCVDAPVVEAALTNMVNQANTAGLRVILATLPPAEYCTTSAASLLPSVANPWQGDVNGSTPENPGSIQRRVLNAWIRTTGSTLPGVVAIADFDAALAYPVHPDFLMPNFTSSDNFHPTGLGYQAQISAIALKSLLGY